MTISNASQSGIFLFVEPWGEEYTMSPGSHFEILAEAEKAGIMEVEYRETGIAVYGWTGSVLTVTCDEQTLSN